MTGTRAAVRYAKAILDVSNAKGNAEVVSADMKNIADAISQSNELKLFLENPVVKGESKLAALNEIFASANADTKNLFSVLLQNKRLDILEAIAAQYATLYDELKGIQVAYVTTATPLTDALEAQVLAKVKELSNKDVSIVNEVNADIIGGFIIRLGDMQYNASIANKLNQLKREFNN
ncbi:ATP synthase F1 subunit delta [Flavobacterium sp. xlx-214]|uniref:ATP synthase F1 subunit delta n=1 Tax=unclassified Flavobacterium TaxID=196869 RepID=UPI0013D56304|nr:MULTISPECIES: ATP synthase F1 subunit delta [unclassified Flavobacterium]MBA5792013.1 ATP synthase F1 subunit delta [Flavobacterium sp. xlx-221]QMI84267.1 ATP synthase F1 subunit delta [Flavobacterium sp. xlx-214]